MATVAHEGNPRNTPDLVVSGTLDGSATLLLEFPIQNSERPLAADPPTIGDTKLRQKCANVFAWGRTDTLDTAFHMTEAPCNLSGTGVDNTFITFDPSIVVTVTPDLKCYGVMHHPMLYQRTLPGYPNVPDFLEYYCSFISYSFGAPLTGPCIAVVDDGTPDGVTLHAIIVDFVNNLAYLVKYAGTSLSSFANASILYSAAYTPTAGDVFYFQVTQNAGIKTSQVLRLVANIYNSNLSTTKWTTTQNAYTITPTPTFGLVAIGGQHGQALWGSAPGGNSCSGLSGTFYTIRSGTDILG